MKALLTMITFLKVNIETVITRFKYMVSTLCLVVSCFSHILLYNLNLHVHILHYTFTMYLLSGSKELVNEDILWHVSNVSLHVHERVNARSICAI